MSWAGVYLRLIFASIPNNAFKAGFCDKKKHIKRMTDLIITPSAYNRIEDIRSQKENSRLNLRISVSGGGCSGFKYEMSFDDQASDNDKLFDDCVVVDDISLPLLRGSTLDYTTSLMGENFKITNPNASSGCGCGESFSI